MTSIKKEGLYFLALGGAQEIGMNMYIYSYNGRFIVVDCGYGFLNDNYPGMDVCFADMSFVKEHKDFFDGVFITHAHEDHFGAISQLCQIIDCPVYSTNFTIELIKLRLSEYGIDNAKLCKVEAKEKIKLGSFEIGFVELAHSVVETLAITIKTPAGVVVHATDWRFDNEQIDELKTNWQELKRLGDEGVDLFVCDSTNIMVEEPQISESDVRKYLINLIPTLKNTVVVTCFSSNLVRLKSLIMAASHAGRTPVLMGRSLIKNVAIAKEIGYFKNLPTCYEIRQAQDISSENALYICTGAQANYRSALTTIASNQNKYIKVKKGDSVIFSSKIIPGNEEKIADMQEKLISFGATVITNEDGMVHTSGHANKADTKKMYELLRPKILLPVHGDKKFIREHKEFGRSCNINQVVSVNNGEVLQLKDSKATVVDKVFVDVIGLDRMRPVSLNSELVKNRKQIAYNGSVFISVIFDKSWELVDLRISSKDILPADDFAVLRDEIVEQVSNNLPNEVIACKHKESAILDYVRLQVRRRIEKATKIKPVTFIHFYKLHE